MSILTAVTLTAVRYVVSAACKSTGLPDDASKAISFLGDYYTDHSQKVRQAIEQANERAWKTAEIALAGKSLLKGLLTRSEDQSLADEISRFIDGVAVANLPFDRSEFRSFCLKELREARAKGILTTGGLDPKALSQRAGDFARFADSNYLRDAEWQSAGAMAGQLQKVGYPNLSQFL